MTQDKHHATGNDAAAFSGERASLLVKIRVVDWHWSKRRDEQDRFRGEWWTHSSLRVAFDGMEYNCRKYLSQCFGCGECGYVHTLHTRHFENAITVLSS